MHLDAAPQFQQLATEQFRIQSSAGANLVKIPIVLKQEFLCLPASAQCAHAPVLHGFHDHGCPKPVGANQIFSDDILRSGQTLGLCFHHFPRVYGFGFADPAGQAHVRAATLGLAS
jgi:hypothetical protein